MMALSQRNSVKDPNPSTVSLPDFSHYDEVKKEKSRNKLRLGSVGLAALLVFLVSRIRLNRADGFDINEGRTTSKRSDAIGQGYELFPFLVDSNDIASSLSSSATTTTVLLSTPTLPSFPIIPRLENCLMDWKPANPPQKREEWRLMFWVSSFPGSGGSNPTKKGNLLRQLMEGLFLGEISDDTKSYGNLVKDFHVSMKNRLKRCIGVSETIGCTSSHPYVGTSPEKQTDKFRPEVIVPIRNPATLIPELFTNKNIAYHSASKQISANEWRELRDRFFEGTLHDWMELIRYWRGTSGRNGEESSYYQTQLYVPFEDIVTSDAAKGTALVKQLSNLLSGTGFFETTKSEKDFECLWYRTAKQEWEREQQIIGDYIPAYTEPQKNMMVRNLTSFAEEIESEIQNEKGTRGGKDSALVSLLRRYAYQIEHYVIVEGPEVSAQ